MEEYFSICIDEAKKAYKRNEIPVGAIIVKDDKVIAKSHNNRQRNYNVLGHAEINCILKAEKKIKDWRLDGCTMYVTLEPCDMCRKIIECARIDKVYFLVCQDKSTNFDNKFTQTFDCDVLKSEYELLLKEFFSNLRK